MIKVEADVIHSDKDVQEHTNTVTEKGLIGGGGGTAVFFVTKN